MRFGDLRLLGATALASSFAALAAAADAPVLKAKAPAAPAVHDWSGFYAGVHGGYGVGTGHSQMIVDVNTEELRATGPRGAIWGAQFGYNFQVGRMVFGIEGDWTWMNASSSNAFTPTGGTLSNRVRLDIDWLASARGRFGIADDRLLLYAALGAAWVQAEASAFNRLTPADGRADISRSLNAAGVAYGAGAEWALGHGFSARAEYLRYVFGVGTGQHQFSQTVTNEAASAKLDSVDVVRAGINYRFHEMVGAKSSLAPAAQWAGVYVGGHAGYAVGAATASVFQDIDGEDIKAEAPRGGVYGAQLGYNQQIGRAVVGIEADWTWLNASTSNAGVDSATGAAFTIEQKIKWLASVRGRLGITADELMLYATLGWGWARYEFHGFNGNASAARQNVNGQWTGGGIVFGGGAEWALGHGHSVRAEYLRYAFGESAGPIQFAPAEVTSHVNAKLSSVDVVRIAINHALLQRPALAAPTGVARWSGFYLGGHGGYGVATSTMLSVRDANAEDVAAEHPRGGIWGAHAGYIYQMGRLVGGVEVDWSWINAHRSNAYSETTPANVSTIEQKIKWLASVRGRVGLTADQLLLYATIGWVWARAEFSAFDPTVAAAFRTVSGTLLASGIAFGGGAEWALSRGFSVRAEYLRYAFGDSVGPFRFNPAANQPVASYRLDSVDVVRAGLNYRFNTAWTSAPRARPN